MEKVTLTELYKQFFMLGVQLLGGGYVIVPLMKKAFIEDRNWLTEDELVNFMPWGNVSLVLLRQMFPLLQDTNFEAKEVLL